MKKLILPALFLMGGFAAKAQDAVTITGEAPWLPNDSTVYLAEFRMNTEFDSAVIKNHKFTITKKLPRGGNICMLKFGAGFPEGAEGEYKIAILYLEPGNVKMTSGAKPGMKTATYDGSTFAREWTYFQNNIYETSPKYSRLPQLEAEINKAKTVGDEDAAEAGVKEWEKLAQERNNDALAFIKKYPNSGVSSFIINIYFNGTKMRDSLLNSLTDHARSNYCAQRMINPDPEIKQQFSFGAQEDKFAVGTVAPDFTAFDADGKKVTLADFKGKYVFLDFWASWCGPCKPQMPFLKAANEKYKGKNMVMLGISLDKTKEAWTKAIEREGLNWLHISNLKGWQEPAALAFEVGAIPANFLIGPDGKIIAKGLYDDNIEKTLSQLIK